MKFFLIIYTTSLFITLIKKQNTRIHDEETNNNYSLIQYIVTYPIQQMQLNIPDKNEMIDTATWLSCNMDTTTPTFHTIKRKNNAMTDLMQSKFITSRK